MTEERRVFARINLKVPLKFLDVQNNNVGSGQTLDISANGVGFITKEDLSTNSQLDIWIYVPDHHDPVYVKGEVVWQQQINDSEDKRVGVHIGKERAVDLGRAWLFKDTHPQQ